MEETILSKKGFWKIKFLQAWPAPCIIPVVPVVRFFMVLAFGNAHTRLSFLVPWTNYEPHLCMYKNIVIVSQLSMVVISEHAISGHQLSG